MKKPTKDVSGNAVRGKKARKRTRGRKLRKDIADQPQAAVDLLRSEKLFAAFMDHLPGYAWIKDVEGRYVYVNKKFLQLHGAVGKTDAELWPAEVASAYLANDRQVIHTKKALQTIEPFAKDPERSHHMVNRFPIFSQDGSVVMVGGASVDISQLMQAEKALDAQALRYKTLMETSTDSIYVLNEKGDLQEANAAFLRRRGYTAAEVKSFNVADWDAQWSPEQLQEKLRGLVGGSAGWHLGLGSTTQRGRRKSRARTNHAPVEGGVVRRSLSATQLS